MAEATKDDFQLTQAGQIPWQERFSCLKKLIIEDLPCWIVVESFRLYEHKAQDQVNSDFPSVRVIGAIEAYLEGVGRLDRLVLQPASVRSRVQILNEHKPMLVNKVHAHDAYQHLRYFFVTKIKRSS